MADNLQIELYKEEEREMDYSTHCSSRSVSPHPGASCSGLSEEPIFAFIKLFQQTKRGRNFDAQ